ncbi:MAG: glycoside hydrolase TIM-barrel-like domain-containing protein [Pseudomonadota bacterium]
MATIALRAAGTFIGSFFGPVGAAIGSAVGTAAGYAIDTSLINSQKEIEGARLSRSQPMLADEGHPIPEVYGHCEVPGTLIWGTRFRERKSTTRSGGKASGPKTTTYSYSCSFAIAVALNPVSMIKRIWVDGRELEQKKVRLRKYLGGAGQAPDPLIEAKQGFSKAPAYRDIAYVVFEDFQLEDYGNRIPQFRFEVVNSFGRLEKDVRAVCLIPGATEYGYSPTEVTKNIRRGRRQTTNRHVTYAESDFEASLDELQATCPNLKAVSLVVPWFGDDLRAGHCQIMPAVVETGSFSSAWRVGNLTRYSANVRMVSRTSGTSNYGGTPSDRSVIDAIIDLKARGLQVTLNPFVMMDIPVGNGLSDPWGDAEQAPHPWRGRITCFPSSTDRTQSARNQVESFLGISAADDFSIAGGTVTNSSSEYSYRRFILHLAHLAVAAGGVDRFLIGSELRSLTRIRDHNDAFPFVDGLIALASDAKGVLGADTKISYGADWSEYFGYQPTDGSGDVYYNLDPLWSHPAIHAVGIDNYMPLADERSDDAPEAILIDQTGDNTTRFDRFVESVRSGEGFDWYYASQADREAKNQHPITDGAHQKPWVFRYKDFASWWQNPHFERRGGVELPTQTAWVPSSKPIWFTEVGCSAVDAGANQPNVFVDPKSSESFFPYFSRQSRDDEVQRLYLEAVLRAISEDTEFNPPTLDGHSRMLNADDAYLWAWDARPYPAFPLRKDVWADGQNWATGHWLNGRLGTAPIAELCASAAERAGVKISTEPGTGPIVQGAAFLSDGTVRDRISHVAETSLLTLNDDWSDFDKPLVVSDTSETHSVSLLRSGTVAVDGASQTSILRQQQSDIPRRVVIKHTDVMQEYRLISTSTDGETRAEKTWAIDTAMLLNEDQGRFFGDQILRALQSEDQTLNLELPLEYSSLSTGDLIAFSEDSNSEVWRINRLEIGEKIKVSATSFRRRTGSRASSIMLPTAPAASSENLSPGHPVFLDLPMFGNVEPIEQARVCFAGGSGFRYALYRSDGGELTFKTVAQAAATTGILASVLPSSSASGRCLPTALIDVQLEHGELSSVSPASLLDGANLSAIRTFDGEIEIIQFQDAEEIAPDFWRLSGLLRGQGGTENAMYSGAPMGADFVLLDEFVVPAGAATANFGQTMSWLHGPSGYDAESEYFETVENQFAGRAFLPFAPVHLTHKTDANALHLTWVRRTRVDGDSWLGVEVPLGEEREAYRIVVSDTLGFVREFDTETPSLRIPYDQLSTSNPTITVEIRQLSAAIGYGLPLTAEISLSN